MKHVTNISFDSYKELWKSIFDKTYRDKFEFDYNGYKLSGGGGNYPSYDLTLAENVFISPEHSFVLSHSFEIFSVPDYVNLLVCNKSTIARLGINASCCTFIDAGFKGNLTIEIMLYAKKSYDLPKGLPIVQVVAIPTMFPCDSYKGKYQNQPNRPVGAR